MARTWRSSVAASSPAAELCAGIAAQAIASEVAAARIMRCSVRPGVRSAPLVFPVESIMLSLGTGPPRLAGPEN
jgi:hypothetical protein